MIKKERLVKKHYENGQLKSEANYKNGKKEGLSKEYYENGQLKSEINWKNGKQEGLDKWYHENGQLGIEGNYKNDKLEGLSKEYYKSGQLRVEKNYENGELEGLYKSYYENGQLEIERNYKNGKRKGLRKEYYESGQLLRESNYKNGELEGLSKEYYESGQLKCETNYEEVEKWYSEEGQLIQEGLIKEYYENNKLMLEKYIKNGKKEVVKFYYKNGQLKYEENWKNGKQEDFEKWYSENGQLQGETNYKNGKMKKKKEKEKNYFAYINDLNFEEIKAIKETTQIAFKVFQISDINNGDVIAKEVYNIINNILETNIFPDEYDNLTDVCVALGTLFGQALCIGLGWNWQKVGDTEEDAMFAVVSPEKNFCKTPLNFIYQILHKKNIGLGGENDNTVLLSYNMLKEMERNPLYNQHLYNNQKYLLLS